MDISATVHYASGTKDCPKFANAANVLTLPSEIPESPSVLLETYAWTKTDGCLSQTENSKSQQRTNKYSYQIRAEIRGFMSYSRARRTQTGISDVQRSQLSRGTARIPLAVLFCCFFNSASRRSAEMTSSISHSLRRPDDLMPRQPSRRLTYLSHLTLTPPKLADVEQRDA
jgi:hypothetical protein